jgi:hypothetical protein
MDQEWCGFTRASSGVRLTEYVLRVIKQVLPIRHSLRVLRQRNRRAMKSVIVLAVLKLLANPLTDHDLSHIRVDIQVSPVKEHVKIASQAAQLEFQVIRGERGDVPWESTCGERTPTLRRAIRAFRCSVVVTTSVRPSRHAVER